MRTIRDIPELKDRNVLLRVDFDVPVEGGQIKEKFRIEKQKETLNYLLDHGAKVIMVAHISAPTRSGRSSDQGVGGSFGDLMPQLHLILGKEINFIKKTEDVEDYLNNYAGPALLENIRQFSGEKENDKEFASRLAKGFDLYINNDFAVSHRNHASISAITDFLPSYAGFLIEEEIRKLDKALKTSAEGKIIIMGGAKASTKIPAIKNLIDKADKILVGGVVANDILKERGVEIGESIVDENSNQILEGLDLNNSKLVVPKDYIISEGKILDIGAETINDYKSIIDEAKVIIWNGPMGMFEKAEFEKGTEAIARAICESAAYKIIGGGDTIAAIDKFGLNGRFDPSTGSGQVFISTGGGAMLAYLAGEDMPGINAIR